MKYKTVTGREYKGGIYITPTLGQNIHRVALDACILADKHDQPVRFDFNGVTLTAHPDQPSAELVVLYHNEGGS